MRLSIAHYDSPIGLIEICATAEAVNRLDFSVQCAFARKRRIKAQPTDQTTIPCEAGVERFDKPLPSGVPGVPQPPNQERARPAGTTTMSGAHPLLEEVQRQLAAYFAGELRRFDLPLALDGTVFQRRVWQRLLSVEYGETASYQTIADSIGNPKAVRAVGAANGRNPVAIVVPCHRIVGSSGQLIGYGGGLWRKEWLLRHEGALLI